MLEKGKREGHVNGSTLGFMLIMNTHDLGLFLERTTSVHWDISEIRAGDLVICLRRFHLLVEPTLAWLTSRDGSTST